MSTSQFLTGLVDIHPLVTRKETDFMPQVPSKDGTTIACDKEEK
jgi:hypothetical protein